MNANHKRTKRPAHVPNSGYQKNFHAKRDFYAVQKKYKKIIRVTRGLRLYMEENIHLLHATTFSYGQ